jgi:hypothetical protein
MHDHDGNTDDQPAPDTMARAWRHPVASLIFSLAAIFLIFVTASTFPDRPDGSRPP